MTSDRSPYDLMPAVHRIRDSEAAGAGALRALLTLVEQELARLREDVDGLYDNWFVETCEEWVVPYLADLLGVQGLASAPAGVTTQRALVANTLAYRRRKGTAAGLEQLARDVTGWPARVVEYFRLLATTQHLDHVRPGNLVTADLRGGPALELIGTPFDTTARTADVRHIDIRRGRHDIPHLGLHLWRLAAYPVAGVDAREVDGELGRWTFDPAGRDVPLFNRPRAEPDIDHLAREVDVPAPLRRRALQDELSGRAAGREGPGFLTGPEPALRIRLDGQDVPLWRLLCCDLSGWPSLPTTPPAPPAPGPAAPDGARSGWVAVDPVLGRLALPPGVRPRRVLVDYAYGLAGDVGAGPHDRRSALVASLPGSDRDRPAHIGGWPVPDWQIAVARDLPPIPGVIVGSLGEAVRLWNARTRRADGEVGVIAVLGSASYDEDLLLEVSRGDRLLVIAAKAPEVGGNDVPGPAAPEQGAAGPAYVASGARPHLRGLVEVTGGPPAGGRPTEVVLDGLSIELGVTVTGGELGRLAVADCTVLGDVTAQDNPALTVRLVRSICRSVHLDGVAALSLGESIVHAGGDVDATAVGAPGTEVEIEACTVLGRTTARTLEAGNAILRGQVEVERRQQGCVRFSFLPRASRTPRRHRCQPEDGTSEIAVSFTSVQPDRPGFCQLAAGCPKEITTGADDEGELGVFHFVGQHRRVANLASQLDTYLRFGLEAGIFLET